MFDDIYKKTLKSKEPSKELIDKTRERVIFEDNKKNRLKPIYTMGVLALVSLVVFIAGNLKYINLKGNDKGLLQNISKEDVININLIGENSSIADMKLAFDPEQTYEEILDLEGIFNYLGKDVRPKDYPKDIKEYDGVEQYRVIYNNDGTVAYDAIQFSYCDDFTYTKLPTRSLHIEVSKLGYQPDCVIYMEEEEMKPSVINGVEMNIGAKEVSYGPYDNPEGYYNFYYAEFYNDEIYYKINGENLEEEEFINILRSLAN